MSKDVQMTIKIEPELKNAFMAAAASRHRPASQIIRDLMRVYVSNNKDGEAPNAITAETIRKSRDNEDVFYAPNASDLFKQLDI